MTPPTTRHTVLAALVAAGMAVPTAQAQTPPTGGELLQRIPLPTQDPDQAPELRIEQVPSAPIDTTTAFTVERIAIEGNTVFDTATLHALVAPGEGQRLTLAGLNTLIARITAYYHANGYPLARAIVPAQTLNNGVVRVRVIEARYDRVALDNRSRVSDDLLQATLAPLQSGELVTQSELDRALLLLGDLPGVRPQATLQSGATVGTSTLAVRAEPEPILTGQVSLDNAGNQYTGYARLGAWLEVNNPLRRGDRLSIGALTSGENLVYGRLGYETVLNGYGTRLGAAYSVLDYKLGDSFEALDAHGTAHVASAWLTQPLLRARDTRLDVELQVDRKRLRDHIDSIDLYGERHTTSGTLSLDGQHRAAGGVSGARLSVTHGNLTFDDAVAKAIDAVTAETVGSYTHWNAGFSRLQSLSARTRLYLDISGQYSNRNLDSSEQFLLGGPNNVRGYAPGALAGASGYLATLELRHDLGWFAAGRTVASVFYDYGSLRINADPWTTGDNHFQLQSAGAGLQWNGANRWYAQLQVAAPVGSIPTQLDEDDGIRAWLQVTKGF